MKLRNNVFVEAFDYLKRNTDIKTQKELARRMGVTDNTITRIMRGYTDVTEDVITKLQTASGCIFNIQWLRGEDPFHMLAEDLVETQPLSPQHADGAIDQSSLTNAALSAQMETIANLKQTIADLKEQHQREIAAKDEIIAKSDMIAEERLHRIAELRRIIDANHYGLEHLPFPHGVADNPDERKISHK